MSRQSTLPPRRRPAPGALTITKRGRYWAVTDAAGQLVCLTVYRCGAREVVRRLQEKGPRHDAP